jgi:hypothetical protein
MFATFALGTLQPSSPAARPLPTLLPTVSFDPAVAIYCPTDFLRIRESPSVYAPIPTMVSPGSEVTRPSEEALAADGYLRYQVRTGTVVQRENGRDQGRRVDPSELFGVSGSDE